VRNNLGALRVEAEKHKH